MGDTYNSAAEAEADRGRDAAIRERLKLIKRCAGAT
jgi:hypothetical protein